jgi:uncharacterized protein YktA (UPF0223 family)
MKNMNNMGNIFDEVEAELLRQLKAITPEQLAELLRQFKAITPEQLAEEKRLRKINKVTA